MTSEAERQLALVNEATISEVFNAANRWKAAAGGLTEVQGIVDQVKTALAEKWVGDDATSATNAFATMSTRVGSYSEKMIGASGALTEAGAALLGGVIAHAMLPDILPKPGKLPDDADISDEIGHAAEQEAHTNSTASRQAAAEIAVANLNKRLTTVQFELTSAAPGSSRQDTGPNDTGSPTRQGTGTRASTGTGSTGVSGGRDTGTAVATGGSGKDPSVIGAGDSGGILTADGSVAGTVPTSTIPGGALTGSSSVGVGGGGTAGHLIGGTGAGMAGMVGGGIGMGAALKGGALSPSGLAGGGGGRGSAGVVGGTRAAAGSPVIGGSSASGAGTRGSALGGTRGVTGGSTTAGQGAVARGGSTGAGTGTGGARGGMGAGGQSGAGGARGTSAGGRNVIGGHTGGSQAGGRGAHGQGGAGNRGRDDENSDRDHILMQDEWIDEEAVPGVID